MFCVRDYRPEDAPALLTLFRDTIRRVNARDYTPAQVDAWASEDIDPAGWAARFTGRVAVVAEEHGRLIGFSDLEESGRLDRLFVSADHQRRGVGRALLEALLAEAAAAGICRVHTESSLTARPFFESMGFVVVAPQVVVSRGVELRNFRMERRLTVG